MQERLQTHAWNVRLIAECAVLIAFLVIIPLVRWRAFLVLTPLLMPCWAAWTIDIVTDGLHKTTFQWNLQIFFSLMSVLFADLLFIQISVLLYYQGSIPFDTSLVGALAYHDDFAWLIGLLTIATLIALLEIIRLIMIFWRRSRRAKSKTTVCACWDRDWQKKQKG
jgi:hypothetical protein